MGRTRIRSMTAERTPVQVRGVRHVGRARVLEVSIGCVRGVRACEHAAGRRGPRGGIESGICRQMLHGRTIARRSRHVLWEFCSAERIQVAVTVLDCCHGAVPALRLRTLPLRLVARHPFRTCRSPCRPAPAPGLLGGRLPPLAHLPTATARAFRRDAWR